MVVFEICGITCGDPAGGLAIFTAGMRFQRILILFYGLSE